MSWRSAGRTRACTRGTRPPGQLQPQHHRANTETGRQHPPRPFWERCDRALNTGGALIRSFNHLRDRQRRMDGIGAALQASANHPVTLAARSAVEVNRLVNAADDHGAGIMAALGTAVGAEMKRRKIIAYTAMTPAYLWLLDPKGPRVNLDKRVGQADTPFIQAAVDALRRQSDQVPISTALPPLHGQLAGIVGTLKTGKYTSSDVADRLYGMASELSGIIGWLYFQNGNEALARRYLGTASRTATLSGDRVLGAFSLCHLANVESPSLSGSPNVALSILDAVYKEANGRSVPRLTGYMHAERGKVLAKLGETAEARHALDEALAVEMASTGDDVPPYLSGLDRADQLADVGSTFGDIGEVPQAQILLESAVEDFGETSPRNRLAFRIFLASLLVPSDVDRACEVAWPALDIARGIGGTRSIGYLNGFVAKLPNCRAASEFRRQRQAIRT